MKKSQLTRSQWLHIKFLQKQIRLQNKYARQPCNERCKQIYEERAKAFAEALEHYEYAIAVKR